MEIHTHSNIHKEHLHTHGIVDASVIASQKGIWAIKWSFAALILTASLQLIVVYFTGSVALIADTIHNFGDAATAIPLWIAFSFARKKPSKNFSYGFGKVEDIAGLVIILIILFSAVVAAYVAIDRLFHPASISNLPALAAASVIGFIGNEAVAVFRIKVGREMNSAALVADGYHARADGYTSLAVLAGAIGVWFGYPIADPVIGLLISAVIFRIVWQSSKSVVIRMIDGVEDETIHEIEHALSHACDIQKINSIKARWSGHKLFVEISIFISSSKINDTEIMSHNIQNELKKQMPYIGYVIIHPVISENKHD